MWGGQQVSPWTAKAKKELFIEGGGLYLEARVGDVSDRAIVANQVDWLYYSGHGSHATNSLMNGSLEQVGPSAVKWTKDLDLVVLAGCSVLDVGDYNNNYQGSEHSSSPGLAWAATGPKIFLGYNYSAPLDASGGTEIIKQWFTLLNGSTSNQIDAWAEANSNHNAWHACAIDRPSNGYYYFTPTVVLGIPIDHTWTVVVIAGQ